MLSPLGGCPGKGILGSQIGEGSRQGFPGPPAVDLRRREKGRISGPRRPRVKTSSSRAIFPSRLYQ